MNPRPTIAECCQALEVGVGATPAQIQRAYKRLVLIWHPDRFLSHAELHAEAEQKIQLFNDAYAFLMEHQDELGREGAGPGSPQRQGSPRDGHRPGPGVTGFGDKAGREQGSRESSPQPRGQRRDKSSTPLPAPVLAVIVIGVLGLFAFSWQLGFQSSDPASVRGPANAPAQVPRVDRDASGPTGHDLEPSSSSIIIDQPSVIIFMPPPGESDGSNRTHGATRRLFSANADSLQAKLQTLRPDINVSSIAEETIVLAGHVFHRNQTSGCGYIIFSPPRPVKMIEGLQDIDTLIKSIVESFPPSNPAGTASSTSPASAEPATAAITAPPPASSTPAAASPGASSTPAAPPAPGTPSSAPSEAPASMPGTTSKTN